MTNTAETRAEDRAFFDANIRTPEMEMAEIGAVVPSADELTIDQINPHNPYLFLEDRWQDHFARLRAEDPVHLNELETSGRYWSVTKYEDVRAVDGDWETYSSAKGITLGLKEIATAEENEGQVGIQTFIAMDPPEHTAQRKTVRSVSAPSNLRNIEPMIRERTAELLDSLPEGESFDWVDTVSIELTTLMLATLFDFPMEDRRKLTRWSDIVFAIPGPGGVVETQQQKIDELLECVDYFDGLFKLRRENPGFDLVSMLANGEATKDIPMVEQLGNLLLLIVGGNDTTRNTMTGSVYGLNKFPDQYDKLLAKPNLISNLVPEVIRWQTPLSYMRRTANHDTELGGKQIKKHDQVLMWYLSANQDEDVFENAHVLDIERHNADRQLSFGYGIHFCMGSRVAELQLRILWEEILQRFKRIEIQEEPERVFSSFVHGYSKLPVTVTRK
ncbi:MAG: cytochrome P450 [Actinomycetota bacterium]|nr:cytochrome P450 [Actinomycetota bacterium]MEC7578002.1 cytochrome P450 [Actinomycetota bacterium]MEC7607956.1 cytochrome P450 [Actinomycetota bacterium]MEC8118346.1 cytochrome P450 [Actinomycetota bacterium]MEE3015926.1 cytochrome P450 [Actinomycetota bacterium]|tara:strand:+ start:585 stop:1919 length:1335 start_codon:yes stop_codon:yes gene_type:complete